MSSNKRRSIGNDPLDSLISAPPKTTTAQPGLSAHTPVVSNEPSKEKKVRATFHIPEELFEAARDATVFLSGPPHRMTLAELVSRGIRNELERLSKAHNNGKPFPPRDGDLKGGRPIKG